MVRLDDGSAARRYHEATKHSPESVRRGPHFLDWENQPLPFKSYRELSAEPLPLDRTPSGMPALGALRSLTATGRSGLPDRRALARLLYYSLGIVRGRRLAEGRIVYFRAAPCTGALYHVDAYLVCGDLPDLGAGVHHFGPDDFALRRLRSGDLRGVLAGATGAEPSVANAPVTIVLASTYWRNAWKYRERAYRHVFWDGGTIVAQLLAVAAADGWAARVVVGFADAEVESLCALDPRREGAFALVAVGGGAPAPAPPSSLAPLSLATEPLSPRELEFPEIVETHRATALADGRAAAAWRAAAWEPDRSEAAAGARSIGAPSDAPRAPIEQVILRRGSTRRFSRRSIPLGALATILGAAAAPLAADYRAEASAPLVDFFVIANAVDGLDPGAYRAARGAAALEPRARGEMRRQAGLLALGQDLAADAAADVYAMVDLDRLFAAFGGRGYRAAELDGGIAGGRMYLAAFALGAGATGLTFFDDDAARTFGLDPRRWGVMFLTAVGWPEKAGG